MGSLFYLPNEALSHILTFCDFRDVLSCQVTCRFLREIINSSPEIQYNVALEISGLQDNPQCTLSVQDKLELLRRREIAWICFRPGFAQEIVCAQQSVVVYELSGGSYMLSGLARDSISHLRLPSEPDQAVPKWQHIPVGDSDSELLDFGLAATEHDLTGVLTTSSKERNTILTITFLQLSTGLPHPLSKSPMQFTQHILDDNLGVGIEIVGDLAALVVRDLSLGHHNRDKVLILDWKRGIIRAELYTEFRRYQSAIFLTPDILLVTNAHSRCLEIWRIPSIAGVSSALLPLIKKVPALSLKLPIIHSSFVVSEFACRGAPNPVLSTLDTKRPFYSSPAESIMIFHLNLAPVNPRVPIPFIFFAHRRTFLDLLEPKSGLESHSHISKPIIPWAEWGPAVTHWIHHRGFPTEWITTTSGQRYAFIYTHAHAPPQHIIVYDFNQNHVRKLQADNQNRHLPPYHGVYLTEGMRAHPSQALDQEVTEEEGDHEGDHTDMVEEEPVEMVVGQIEVMEEDRGVEPEDLVDREDEHMDTRTKNNETDRLWRRIWIEDGQPKDERMIVFEEQVGGNLPCVAVQSALQYNFNGLLMDEERLIGIKRNHLGTGVESIEVMHFG